MNEPFFISREKPAQRSMDYEALRQEGIALLQRHASDIWTDYNVHDPGVTILEYLCYGITDIGYRCNFSIRDFLYAKDINRPEPVNNAFFQPREILPSAALTVVDYRKLIIDRIVEVQNAWIIPLKEQKQGYKGLYAVRIQVKDELQNKTNEAIIAEVHDLLCSNRNLCEDVESVVILEQVKLDVSAKIELENDASVEHVLADVLHQIEHLVPEIHISSLEDMQAEGLSMNEIMEGPEPMHGLIKTGDLKPLPPAIYVSEIRDILNATTGISRVEAVRLKVESGVEISVEYNLGNNIYPVLSDRMKNAAETNYPITFYRNGRQVTPNSSLAMQILNASTVKESSNYQRLLNFAKPAPAIHKKLQDIGMYYSIQRFFPAVYGIGAYGLSKDAGILRHAQARQLKGYLALMEVFLADYLKKLTQIKYLFSIEEGNEQTVPENPKPLSAEYLAEILADIPDAEPLWNSGNNEPTTHLNPETIRLNSKSTDEFNIESRHQFINHLLARFAENLDESLFCFDLSTQQNPEAMRKAALEAKCRMLREYDSLSRDRGLGFDYRAQKHAGAERTGSWGVSVSGFKKRICAYLNINRFEDRSLTAFFPFKGNKLEKITHKNAQKEDVPKLPLRTLIKHGALESFYSVDEATETASWKVAFKMPAEGDPAFEKAGSYPLYEKAKSAEDAIKWRDEFIRDVVKFDVESKGLFVLEHILLRPRLSNDNVQIRVIIKEGDIDVEFVSVGFGDPEKMDNIAEKLLLLASKEENYEMLQDGPYDFPVITQSKRPVLVSTRNYGKTQALALKKALIKLFTKTLKEAPGKVNKWIEHKSIPAKGLDLNAFYSHRLSIVLPDWPVDFMEKESQMSIEYLVAQHVPAHLRVDFHWLSWTDLKNFESRYKSWLEAKNNNATDDKTLNDRSFELCKFLAPNEIGDTNSRASAIQTIYDRWLEARSRQSTDNKTLFDLSFKLVKTLAENKIGDPDPDPDLLSWIPEYGFKASEMTALYQRWQAAQKQDSISDKAVNELLFSLNGLLIKSSSEDSILRDGKPDAGLQKSKLQSIFKEFPYLAIDPEDLQAIEGIDADTEKWLKNNLVYNWTVLSKADPDLLLRKPRSPNLSKINMKEIISWKDQAEKITKAYDTNKWEAFEQYQMSLPGQVGAGTHEPKIKRLAELKKRTMYLS